MCSERDPGYPEVARGVPASDAPVFRGRHRGIDLHKLARVGSTSFFGKQVQLVHPERGIYLAVGASVAFIGFALALAVMGRSGPSSANAFHVVPNGNGPSIDRITIHTHP
jgi:hypothetical protein